MLTCGSDSATVWDLGKAVPFKPLGRADVGETSRFGAKLHVLQVRWPCHVRYSSEWEGVGAGCLGTGGI